MKMFLRFKKTTGKFGKDEDGAVMILTMIMILLLAKVAMSTYNVGILAAERIRLQVVADASAYSSAVWQARFLNYCAYTRRAIIANWSQVAMATAADAHNKMLKEYVDKEIFTLCLASGFANNPENSSIPHAAAEILHQTYESAILPIYKDMEMRESAEHLNALYAASTEVLYNYVRVPWRTIMPEIVESSNLAAENRNLAKIELIPAYVTAMDIAMAANRPGMLNNSYLEQLDADKFKEDLEKRWDDFSDPRSPNFIPYVSRRGRFQGWHGYGVPIYGCGVCMEPGRTVHILFGSNRHDWNFNNKKTKTSEENAFGQYQCGNITLLKVCVFCIVPMIEIKKWEAKYDLKYDKDDIKQYNIKATNAAELEPSVYAAVRIKKESLRGTGAGDGLLFGTIGIPLTDQVRDMRAVSRAKVVFQPRFNNTVYKPNLYYPYFEARLAPFFGGGYFNTTNPIRTNGTAVLTAANQDDKVFLITEHARRIHY